MSRGLGRAMAVHNMRLRHLACVCPPSGAHRFRGLPEGLFRGSAPRPSPTRAGWHLQCAVSSLLVWPACLVHPIARPPPPPPDQSRMCVQHRFVCTHGVSPDNLQQRTREPAVVARPWLVRAVALICGPSCQSVHCVARAVGEASMRQECRFGTARDWQISATGPNI